MLIGNFGRRGQGKTTLAVYAIDKLDRRAVLDPRSLIRRPGAIVLRSAARLRDGFEALAAGDADELVYSPIEAHRQAFEAFAGELKRWTIEYPDLELGVLIDEASFYAVLDPRAHPNARETFAYVLKACDLERFHVVITCHRPADLAPDIRALMNRWCIFRTTQEHDLAVLRERCSAAVVAIVPTLADREYVAWNDDDATAETNRAPFVWYSDLAPASGGEYLELR
jgi:hypothetical protein